MKYLYSLILISLARCLLFAQTEQASGKLLLTKVSNNTYVHSCNNNNGVVYIVNNEAIIVSTPDSETETQNLIDWVREKHQAKIIAYVIDRWHPDAIGGLDVVHKNGLKSYSCSRTKNIAVKKGLPIPQVTFDSTLTLLLGSKKVICHYLGEAHTSDGIVVWIKNEKVLFGGNGIRNFNGWIGNIWDSNLRAWSSTARNIKRMYSKAKVVVPGHGKYGGIELIDYTINLYDSDFNGKNTINIDTNFLKERELFNGIRVDSYESINLENKTKFNKGVISYTNNNRSFKIHTDSTYDYNPQTKTLHVYKGFLSFSKDSQTYSFDFENLYFILREDEVEAVLIVKKIKNP